MGRIRNIQIEDIQKVEHAIGYYKFSDIQIVFDYREDNNIHLAKPIPTKFGELSNDYRKLTSRLDYLINLELSPQVKFFEKHKDWEKLNLNFIVKQIDLLLIAYNWSYADVSISCLE